MQLTTMFSSFNNKYCLSSIFYKKPMSPPKITCFGLTCPDLGLTYLGRLDHLKATCSMASRFTGLTVLAFSMYIYADCASLLWGVFLSYKEYIHSRLDHNQIKAFNFNCFALIQGQDKVRTRLGQGQDRLGQ